MREVRVAEALELLDRAVAAKGGDYIYEWIWTPETGSACLNFHEGQPSCLIGHVLSYLGVTPDMVVGRNGHGVWVVSRFLCDQGIVRFSPLAEAALSKAQEAQDNGDPWGRAVTLAKTFVTARAGNINDF